MGSISFVAALPDGERQRVLERVRVLALDADHPLRLGYTTEAYVYSRVSPSGAGPTPRARWTSGSGAVDQRQDRRSSPRIT